MVKYMKLVELLDRVALVVLVVAKSGRNEMRVGSLRVGGLEVR